MEQGCEMLSSGQDMATALPAAGGTEHRIKTDSIPAQMGRGGAPDAPPLDQEF